MVIFPFLIWVLVTQVCLIWESSLSSAIMTCVLCCVCYSLTKKCCLKKCHRLCFPWGEGLCFYSQLHPLLWGQCLAHNKYFVNICSMEKGRNDFPLISQHQAFVAFRSEPLHPHSLQMSAAGTISTLLWQGNAMHRGPAFCVLSSLKYRMDFQAWETMLITNVNHLGQELMMERKPNRCKGQLLLKEPKELPQSPCLTNSDEHSQTPWHFQDSLAVRFSIDTAGHVCPGKKIYIY